MNLFLSNNYKDRNPISYEKEGGDLLVYTCTWANNCDILNEMVIKIDK